MKTEQQIKERLKELLITRRLLDEMNGLVFLHRKEKQKLKDIDQKIEELEWILETRTKVINPVRTEEKW